MSNYHRTQGCNLMLRCILTFIFIIMGSLELSANVVQAPKTGSVDAQTSSSSGEGELCDKWYSGKLAGFLFWGKKASDAEVISCVEKVGVNFRSRYGSTPINHAVSYAHVSVSRLILLRSLGADVNIPDNFETHL